MNIDLDQVRQRIEARAREAAGEGETVAVVRLSPRSDVPAWGCEVEWIRRDGIRESMGYAGPLSELENSMMAQIRAHEMQHTES